MNPIKILTVALLLPLLAACAAGGGRTSAMSDDEALQTRSAQRWKHLIAKETEAAWEYLSPGYRGTQNRTLYIGQMKNRPVRWTDVEYVSHECERPGELCKVNLRIDYTIRSHLPTVGMIDASRVISERWIKLDEGWFHVPRDVAE